MQSSPIAWTPDDFFGIIPRFFYFGRMVEKIVSTPLRGRGEARQSRHRPQSPLLVKEKEEKEEEPEKEKEEKEEEPEKEKEEEEEEKKEEEEEKQEKEEEEHKEEKEEKEEKQEEEDQEEEKEKVPSSENDVNLKCKDLSKEFVVKRQVGGESENNPVFMEELNLEEVNHHATLAVVTFIFLIVILGMIVKTSEAAVPIPTKQILPPDCVHWLEHHDYECPDPESFDGHWKELNQTCCNPTDTPPPTPALEERKNDMNLTVFHCQKEELNGTTYAIAGCLPKETVPPRKLGQLVKNQTTGLPEVDLETECPPDQYRDQETESWKIYIRSCRYKTQIQRGEEACDRGPAADNLLYCKEGFNNSCTHGFNDHYDSCSWCQPLTCSDGQQPFRRFSGPCNDSSTTVEYGCDEVPTTTSSSTSFSALSSSQRLPEGETTVGINTSPTTTKGTLEDGKSGKGIIIAGAVAAVMVGLFLFVWWWRSKKSGSCSPSLASASSSSGSNSDDGDESSSANLMRGDAVLV